MATCEFCDRPPVITAEWRTTDGRTVVAVNHYCHTHRDSSLNWTGQITTYAYEPANWD